MNVARAFVGHEWVLNAVDREGGCSLIDDGDATPTITFTREGVSGFGGCNQYSGSFTMRGPYTLVIEVLATTLKACPEGEDREMFFFGILTEPMTFGVSANKLELFSTVSDTVLIFSR